MRGKIIFHVWSGKYDLYGIINLRPDPCEVLSKFVYDGYRNFFIKTI
jgi:hypothetical protein